MKHMFRNRKILYFILSITLVCVFTLTIAYSALSAVLKITGNAEVVASSWDIYLDNVELINGSVTSNVPTITDKTTVSFTTTLTNPGDYYIFTIDVVNKGSIDAMIDNIEKLPQLSVAQAKYLNYIVEYQSGESINTKQLVEANSFVRLKVKVEFRKDISAVDLPTTSQTLNLSFKVNYVQADDGETSNVVNSGKLVKVVSGDYDTVGSEVCIGDECFYVISSTENDVTMLAKYNLYVGGRYLNGWTAYGDAATGIQDSTMIGWKIGGQPYDGVTPFSNSDASYNGSIVEEYVNNYAHYLSTLGITIDDARLITVDELHSLGCYTNTKYCGGAKNWVYQVSYWSMSISNNTNLWAADVSGDFNIYIYNNNIYFGVRPVITISKLEF